MKIVVA